MSLADRRRPALGRGMAALLPNAAPPPAASRAVMQLPIEAVERSKEQPRKRFDERQLEELAASIREHGVVEPILVRRHGERYRIVAGERRWRAAQRAGLKDIPALLREAGDREAFELALVENLQRTDLNAIEEAEAYEFLLKEHGLTQEEVAGRVGKERSTVANGLRLLKLPAEVRDMVRDGRLEMGHARALLALERSDSIRKMAHEVVRAGLSVRATEALVRKALAPEGARGRNGADSETPAVRAVVNRLQRRLGARCRLAPRTAQAGKIEIEYTSLEELDGILARIGA
ncbi:MAG TPA: ParB/RepB/Spo0J family partition protein [Anaeromyxobacteraceae bacterium]|nr:ParB/RepB/Spo0J family partition protein [Anaeromyxobacteraceae bacterium]